MVERHMKMGEMGQKMACDEESRREAESSWAMLAQRWRRGARVSAVHWSQSFDVGTERGILNK